MYASPCRPIDLVHSGPNLGCYAKLNNKAWRRRQSGWLRVRWVGRSQYQALVAVLNYSRATIYEGPSVPRVIYPGHCLFMPLARESRAREDLGAAHRIRSRFFTRRFHDKLRSAALCGRQTRVWVLVSLVDNRNARILHLLWVSVDE